MPTGCFATDIEIKGDTTGSLKKLTLDIAEGFNDKAVTIASYFTSPEFAEYLKREFPESNGDYLIAKGNWTKLRAIMRRFYEGGHLSIINTANRRQGSQFIYGFENVQVMRDAEEHTISVITDEYLNAINEYISGAKTLSRVVNKIFGTFIDSYGSRVWDNIPNTDKFKSEYLEEYNEVREIRSQLIKELNDKIEANKNNKGDEKKKVTGEINTIKAELVGLNSKIFNILNTAVRLHGNNADKAYANLTFRLVTNPNDWFDKVFRSKKVNKYRRFFDSTIENGDIDISYFEDDTNFENAKEDTDVMSHGWNDETNRFHSFTQMIDIDVSLYLGSIKHLKTPGVVTNGNVKYWNYDTDNTLGTATIVGGDYVLAQIHAVSSKYNIDTFIESLDKAANTIKGLEFLSKIAQDCRDNENLANRLFHEVSSYAIDKSIIDITNDGIKNGISNTASNTLSNVYYNLLNIAKFTIKDAYNTFQADELRELFNKLGPNEIHGDNLASNKYKIAIKSILSTYFPQIDLNAVDSYLNNTKNYVEEYKSVIQNLISFVEAVNKVINSEEELVKAHNDKMKAWRNSLKNDDGKVREKPVMNYDAIPYDMLNQYIINIAKMIAPYTATRNELNSINAEGNLGSDLLQNNNITNLFKQINYATPNDEFAGLRKLGEFVSKVPQYKHSPVFWGIKDEKGNIISNGLFIREGDSFTINPNAKKLFSFSLFNGVRNQNDGNNELYNNMSKVDYFISSLVNFRNPSLSLEQYGAKSIGGYFLRTPSDAPKNFIINTTKYSTNGLFKVNEADREAYNKERGNELYSNLNMSSEDFTSNYKKYNEVDLNDIIDIIDGKTKEFNFAGYNVKKINDKEYHIPFRVNFDGGSIDIIIAGNKVGNTRLFDNLKVVKSYSKQNNKYKSDDYAKFRTFLSDFVIDEGISNGRIKRNIERSHSLFYAFRQQLLNEVSNLVFNLNNVIDVNDGYKTKSNTSNLFERYHYKGEVVKDGKLTGNVFNLTKLFATTGYNAGEDMLNFLSLYGGMNESLFNRVNDSKLRLNVNHPLIYINPISKAISLNESYIAEKLSEVTENWINAFTEDIVAESKQYKTAIGDNFTESEIIETMLNCAFMDMNFDDLFEGDSKFYKNSRDFFKRAKEVQASGKSYAATDFDNPIGTGITQLKNRQNQEIFIEIGDIKIPVNNGFRGVTIKNTVRPSDHAEAIYNELLKVNKDLPKSTRERIAMQIAKGFGYKSKRDDTITNDAQSYITIEEWVRRTYLAGELDKYMDIVPTLLNPDATAEDIRKLPIDKINKFIQVGKNFYFDRQFDADTQTVYPRQIKNAEFVLIPALVKGTSLGDLYKIMQENEIDQINTAETDKAAKRVTLEYWNNNGIASDEAKKSFKELTSNKKNTESYYYRYLYKQQSVAQHMQDQRNKAGIQIMKKIIDNADPEVQGFINDFFNAYVANISAKYNNFIDKMGWRYYDGKLVDKETHDTIRFTEFYKRAKEESERLGMDSNFIDYVTLDSTDNVVMPDYMNIAASKFESIAQSMFNSGITRQTLPGWHAAQVTSVGYSDKLKFDPESGVMEVLLPRWAVDIPKDYNIEELAKEDLDLHIGYRIPTEGKQSVAILRVVGFLDDVQGSTIIVPDEWVTKTGSDFDIDSVYGISFKHKINKDKKLVRIKPIIGEGEKLNEVSTNIEAVKKRYRDYLRVEVYNLYKKNKYALFDTLSSEKYDFTNFEQVKSLFKSQKGIDYLVGQLDVMGLKRFSKLTVIEQQTEDARNNVILESMINIMKHTSTREENYSRSNFERLSSANDFVSFLRKRFDGQQNKVESVYNPFDQINYMEDGMSGASLKAFSVTRDTFNSVCNHSKAVLNDNAAITVEYDLTETIKEVKDSELVDTGVAKYNKEDIKAAYGDNVTFNGNTAIVTHKQFAWSNNNRNIVGELLTPYSSQTTAHILDAIKIGSIYNENKFTFGTFKTLIDLGIDYDTAIAFLQQPAITEIVKAFNETNSVYANVNGRPIEVALARISNAAGITINDKDINDYTSQFSIFKVLSENAELQKHIQRLTGGSLTKDGTIKVGQFTLSGKRLQERFMKPKISKIENNYTIETFAEDLVTLLHFTTIYNNTARLEKVIRCTNPDKFGAKQSVFSTRAIINNIKEYLENDKEVGDIVKVGNTPLLEALYPGIRKNDIDINASCYKYLAAFMKYATMTSIDINSRLFSLEKEEVYTRMKDLQNMMGITFNEEKANAFKQYIVTDIYRAVPQFTNTYTVDDYGHFRIIDSPIPNTSNYFDNEIDRLFGYKEFTSGDFTITGENPTEEELIEFIKLTPAQKVVYIKNKYGKDNAGIFNYINVNKFKGKDILQYNDTIGDIEDLYIAFNNSFFNRDKLLRLATLDLIKYAFVVEGFRFKKGAISKIISNDALLANTAHQGVGDGYVDGDSIISAIRREFNRTVSYNITDAFAENFSDKFVRSHSNYLRSITVGKSTKNSFGEIFEQMFNVGEGIFKVFHDDTQASKDVRSRLGIKVDKDGNVDESLKYVKIVRNINKKQVPTLYKLVYKEDAVYGYPMNLLDTNEVSDYSYNNENNKYLVSSYYEQYIDYHSGTANDFNLKRVDNKIDIHETKRVSDTTADINALQNILIQGKPVEQAAVKNIVDDITAHYQNPVKGQTDKIVVHNDSYAIRNLIPNRSNPTFKLVINGVERAFTFKRVKLSEKVIKIIKEGSKKRNIKIAPELLAAKDKFIKDNITVASNVYIVEPIVNLQELEETLGNDYAYDDTFGDEDTLAYSTTGIIADEDLIINNPFDSFDDIAKRVVETIFRDDSSYYKDGTLEFKKAIESLNIDKSMSSDIHNNRTNIFKHAAEYYTKKAQILKEKIDSFNISDEASFNIADEELYRRIKDNDELYNELVKLILDCYTFGNQFKDIIMLDAHAEDAELNRYVNEIKKAINSVSSNLKVKKAMANIFNIYLVEATSTNPNINSSILKHGLLNLRDTFNDSAFFDSKISSIHFLNNKQVQVVTKYIMNKIYGIETVELPKILNEFDTTVNEIMTMAGSLSWDKIVGPGGRLINKYTEQFIKDRKAILDNYRANADKGITSVDYWVAKLARDKWFVENTEQELVADYYKETVANDEKAFNEAREEFIEYQTIINELRSIEGLNSELDRTDLVRRKNLLNQLSFFTSKFNEDGTEKSAEKQAKLAIIKEWKLKKKEINNKYFDSKVAEEVKLNIEDYSERVRRYDAANPTMSLSEKLEDEAYREAYEWLSANTTMQIDTESNEKLLEAYAKFTNGENDRQIRINAILKGKDVYDANGNLDVTKISIEDMEQIKALYETEQSKAYTDEDYEASLIKCIAKPTVIAKDSYYDTLNKIFAGTDKDVAKGQDIKAMNALLSKGLDENGLLDVSKLFRVLTEAELDELEKISFRLNDDKSNNSISKEDGERLKALRTTIISKKAKEKFEDDLANIKKLGEYHFSIFKNIFCAKGKKGKIAYKNSKYQPNSTFYGYTEVNNKFIDDEKTKAKQLINDNTRQTVKAEFYEEYEKYKKLAASEGNTDIFNRWYKANTIYNPTTHRVEPLAIWKKKEINPNGSLNAHYEYTPIYEHTYKEAKESSFNPKHNPTDRLNYNGKNYVNNVSRNEKEERMYQFIKDTLKRQAFTNSMNIKADEGFMPRRAGTNKDAAWYARQGLAFAGLQWSSYREKSWTDRIAYEEERDITMSQLEELKGKGYIDIKKIKKDDYATKEEYEKAIKEAKENNTAIDAKVRNNDWISILHDYVHQSEIARAKNSLKNTALLLIEDLRNNPAIKVNHRGNLAINNRNSTNTNDSYYTTPQTNTLAIVENWYKRMFKDEFKQKSSMNEVASLFQNITSAKYMVFNVTGGIANIWTGVGNMLGESFAGEFFTNKDFVTAAGQYGSNIVSFFADMYSEKASTFTNALIKRFNVVDFEAMTERNPNETTAEYIKRIRNLTYGLQSGGEHFMQNTALIAMLKSHRVYTNDKGKKVVGTLDNYLADTERRVLKELVESDPLLYNNYLTYIGDIKGNKNELYKIETGKVDLNVKFLKIFGNKELINNYIAAKKKAIEEAKKEFNNDELHPTFETLFKFENGQAVFDESYGVSKDVVGAFKDKVITVNQKIHGVYDKIGAAQIEKHWWGTLVMQYHKHLYPGIMKRWRIKGYYNEHLQAMDKGSYISAINLLTINFDEAISKAKKDADGRKTIMYMKSVQNICAQLITNIHEINTNFHLMSKWEQNNILRCQGDLYNVLACIIMAATIHALNDDEDIKDSNMLSTLVYLADRFSAEAQAYTPWGAYSEAKTLYSSPIASANGPTDVIKLVGLTGQLLFDPNFETEYSTGLYKGRNKFEILLTRNVPGLRVANRLNMMSKNNQYYRITNNPISKLGKTIGNAIQGEE